MARLLTAGFETGSIQELNGAVYQASVTADQARTGNYALELNTGPLNLVRGYVTHTLGADYTELYFRFALRFSSGAAVDANSDILILRDSNGDEQVTLRYSWGTQTLDLYQSAALVQAGTVTIRSEQWYVIQVHVVIDNSGSFTTKVNNVTDLSFSGDTQATSIASVRSFMMRGGAGTTGYENIYIDDIAVNDTAGSYQNSWPGLGGIFMLKPNADGAVADFTPSAGSDHYALVDDVPANTTDWVQGDTTPGSMELFAVEATPAYVTAIDLLEVIWQAAVVESGSNELKGVVRQGSTNYADASGQTILSIEPDYVLFKSDVYYVQPADSSAWDATAVDAVQVGVEIA